VVGLLSDVLHLVARLLLAHAIQHVASFLQILCSLPGVGLSLRLRLLTLLPLLSLLLRGGSRLAHVTRSIAKPAEGLLQLALLIALQGKQR